MIVPRVISVVALLSYVVLLFMVRGNLRRREVRSFALYLVAMLIWQVGVTGASFASDPMVALNFYKVAIRAGLQLQCVLCSVFERFLGHTRGMLGS